MNFSDRIYPDIVRDLLTVLTGGTVAEIRPIGAQVDDLIYLENRPVHRISHLAGKVRVGAELIDYRFSEREFELVGTAENPLERAAIRFRDRAVKPAPHTELVVNYYPERLKPTPITDINIGSVARTLIETISREIATQYQQLDRVYKSAFVETAEGSSLEKVAALVDTRRLKQGHAIGKVRFSRRLGSPGSVFIPIDTAVSDGTGSRYLTSHEATLLPNQAGVEVWVHGESERTKVVEAGRLTVLERAIAGVDRVVNDEATYRSTEEETDAQLATRARRAIHATGKGTRDAIRFGLEGLEFVSAVTLSEYPDPAVSKPGVLRLDVALSQDNDFNRRIVDRRIEELRPAGIFIDRHWAGRTNLGFSVDLLLAGAGLPTSAVADIKDGITQRLVEYARSLGPGSTLRRSRLGALVLQDDNLIDATLRVTADGNEITGDTWALPAGTTAGVDSLQPVTFGPIRFEQAAGDEQLVRVQVDADLTVGELSVGVPDLEKAIKNKLTALLGQLPAGGTISFDQIAAAIRDDSAFALKRSDSVLVFDQEGGGFTELRDGDSPYEVPAAASLVVRTVHITEEAA